MGRLASIVAKELLNGQRIVSDRATQSDAGQAGEAELSATRREATPHASGQLRPTHACDATSGEGDESRSGAAPDSMHGDDDEAERRRRANERSPAQPTRAARPASRALPLVVALIHAPCRHAFVRCTRHRRRTAPCILAPVGLREHAADRAAAGCFALLVRCLSALRS